MGEPGDAVNKIHGGGGTDDIHGGSCGTDDIHSSVRSLLGLHGVHGGEQGSSMYGGSNASTRICGCGGAASGSVGAAGSSLSYGGGSGKSWTGPVSWTDMGYTISWSSPTSGASSWISGDDETNSWTGGGRGSWSATAHTRSWNAATDTRSARGGMSCSAGTDTRSARGAMSSSAGGKTTSCISDGGRLCIGGLQRGRETRKGAWWDVKAGRIAVEGVDFAQDTQEGGGDEYIFICDSDEGVEDKKSKDDNEFAPETKGGMHSEEKMDFAGYSQEEEYEPMDDFQFEMVCAMLPRFTETFKKNRKKE